MRVRAIWPADCARACQQLSLRLDSELSEFDGVLLEAHLARCADCRAFGQSITVFTEALRAVPAERSPVSFQLPRSRTRMDALASSLRAGSAVAAVAVVVLGGLVALQGSRDRVPGVDLHKARMVMDVHESQLQQLDNFGETPTREVPPGLAAAEGEAPPGAAQRARLDTSTPRHQGRR